MIFGRNDRLEMVASPFPSISPSPLPPELQPFSPVPAVAISPPPSRLMTNDCRLGIRSVVSHRQARVFSATPPVCRRDSGLGDDDSDGVREWRNCCSSIGCVGFLVLRAILLFAEVSDGRRRRRRATYFQAR